MQDLIDRYYDVSLDFGDSISLCAILLIFHKKTDKAFDELKDIFERLNFDDSIIDAIEDISLHVDNAEMVRLIKLLSPIDDLIDANNHINNADRKKHYLERNKLKRV